MANNFSSLSKDKLKSISKEMNLGAKNLYSLLKNLLEWSRLKRGNYEIDLWNLSLSEIVKTAIESIENIASLKQIRITNNITSEYHVFADDTMLNSILVNLLSNAIKFTNRGGQIIVNAKETEKSEIEISIADNGIGMSSELISKLFKIDEKVGRIGTEGEPSAGLGLLLCKEFIEEQNGRVWVESKEGHGTAFYFTLPLQKE